jgi:hypothetical protein
MLSRVASRAARLLAQQLCASSTAAAGAAQHSTAAAAAAVGVGGSSVLQQLAAHARPQLAHGQQQPQQQVLGAAAARAFATNSHDIFNIHRHAPDNNWNTEFDFTPDNYKRVRRDGVPVSGVVWRALCARVCDGGLW